MKPQDLIKTYAAVDSDRPWCREFSMLNASKLSHYLIYSLSVTIIRIIREKGRNNKAWCKSRGKFIAPRAWLKTSNKTQNKQMKWALTEEDFIFTRASPRLRSMTAWMDSSRFHWLWVQGQSWTNEEKKQWRQMFFVLPMLNSKPTSTPPPSVFKQIQNYHEKKDLVFSSRRMTH